VDVVEAMIQNVDFVWSVSIVPLDLGTLTGEACATPRQDGLPHGGPGVFLPQLLARCLPTGMRWIVNNDEDFLP
jgi:hypothetical protein